MPLYKETLRDVMNKKCPDRKKVKLFLGLCNAVKYAHSHDIIHRDIKPENVMINGNDVALGDFGIAHFKDSSVTTKDERLANFAYSAPEQKTRHAGRIGFETDIYSLGLILNELFTGALPIGNNPRKILFKSPIYGFLDDIVNTMIVSNQDYREKNIQLVIDKIEFKFENTLKNYRSWRNQFTLPDYIVHGVNTMKRQIYADLRLADALINDHSLNWARINPNYHMNFGYSAPRLIDTVVFFKIMEEVKNKFIYESANYLQGPDQFYKPLEYEGKDKPLMDQFVEKISKLKLLRGCYGDNAKQLKGCCVKYFQNICDYHAKEVIEKIPTIINQCNEDLLDAPILWIAHHTVGYIEQIKSECGMDNFRFETMVVISQKHCKLPLDNLSLYTYSMDEEKKRTDGIISKLHEIFHKLVIDSKDGKKYDLYFTKKEWAQFKKICKFSISKIRPDEHIYKEDIIELYHISKYEYSDTLVLLHLYDFDFTEVLYRVLFPENPNATS